MGLGTPSRHYTVAMTPDEWKTLFFDQVDSPFNTSPDHHAPWHVLRFKLGEAHFIGEWTDKATASQVATFWATNHRKDFASCWLPFPIVSGRVSKTPEDETHLDTEVKLNPRFHILMLFVGLLLGISFFNPDTGLQLVTAFTTTSVWILTYLSQWYLCTKQAKGIKYFVDILAYPNVITITETSGQNVTQLRPV